MRGDDLCAMLFFSFTRILIFSHAQIASLLQRIGQAIESCAERLDEECVQYNKAASMEEERVNLLTNVLCSMNVGDMGGGLGLDDNHDDKEDAIHRYVARLL